MRLVKLKFVRVLFVVVVVVIVFLRLVDSNPPGEAEATVLLIV